MRLPHQATGWTADWKEELKTRLRALPGRFLAARYESPVRDNRCDAENILFYNASGAFATSTYDGLRFERLFGFQPCPIELNGPSDHYSRYAPAGPREPFDGWTETAVLAEFSGVELPWIKFDSNPALVWFPLRQMRVDTRATSPAGSPFAIRLRVDVPPDASAAANLAKCLFDGVVASFQGHDGWEANAIADWMEARFSFDAAQVARLLTTHPAAVLGRRRLLNRWGSGYQWAPDDDLCVAGEIEMVRSRKGSGRRFRLSGMLSAVAEKPLGMQLNSSLSRLSTAGAETWPSAPERRA